MTATLLQGEFAPVKLRPLHAQPNLRKWREELIFWNMEVKFFAQLLGSGIHHCRNFNQARLAALRHEFLKYREETLPQLDEALEELLCAPLPENERGHGLQKKFERHAASLKKLKAEVFPHLFDLQSLTIQ